MEALVIIAISLCISLLVKSLISSFSKRSSLKLPPGPPSFPIISSFLWLRKSPTDTEPILRSMHAKYGPIFTLHRGSSPTIYISSHSLAHQALIQNGAVFASRPGAHEMDRISTTKQYSKITTAPYGHLWRLLRRNLTSEILHPSRVKCYSHARRWVLEILINKLKSESKSGDHVCAVEHFQFAMFSLLALMSFGDKLDELQIKKIEDAQRTFLSSLNSFNILNLWPKVGRILFYKKWEEFFRLRKKQADVFIPLIQARRELKLKQQKGLGSKDGYVSSYVDTLIDFEFPNENRKLTDDEIVVLCSEFLGGGTDTTTAALQWIMANLVKYPDVQKRVYEEIKGVVGPNDVVNEDDLHKMVFLKAVVLEGLRRHPPAHFLVPHAVTKDVELSGYLIPKDCSVQVMVVDMGLDPDVWENPLEFNPDRFLHNDENGREAFDITGSREIKMMPFGAGRRICPGLGIAMLHLEYFVANLVWSFDWDAFDAVDLSEKESFSFVMKNPLRAKISPRLFNS